MFYSWVLFVRLPDGFVWNSVEILFKVREDCMLRTYFPPCAFHRESGLHVLHQWLIVFFMNPRWLSASADFPHSLINNSLGQATRLSRWSHFIKQPQSDNCFHLPKHHLFFLSNIIKIDLGLQLCSVCQLPRIRNRHSVVCWMVA